MKVCHFTSVHSHNDTRILLKECTTIARAGYQTCLVAPGKEGEAEEAVTGDGVEIIQVPVKSGGRLLRMTKTAWSVYRQAKGLAADLYHFHDPELLPFGLLLKYQGKKVVYDVHEHLPRQILSKYWIKKPLRRMVAGLVDKLELFMAKRLDAVVTATTFIGERFRRAGCQTETINNYPLVNELAAWQGSEPTALDWGQRRRAVCYIGKIAGIRGIYQMVGAMRRTACRLVLGGTYINRATRAEVVKLAGWSRVDELGQLNRGEMGQVLAQVRAGLVLFHPEPNHIDAQPNKLFEYMSAGIPVIGSNFPLWQEIIEGNGCGVCVDPLDEAAIAAAIEDLCQHDAKAMEMGRKGRRAVEQRYNWAAEEDKLLGLYGRLLGGR
ncbi:MAG TPA: glycosyltransferase family 4 protein [Bacillota bacterium]|nr:glycosyltransferase family 4 protein [Bacillota bacterium]